MNMAPILRAAFMRWMDDSAPRMAASLSYYALFALAPLLLLLVSITGLVFGREAAEGQIVGQLRGFIGHQSALAIQSMLQSAWKPAQGVWATGVSIGTLFFGAMGVMLELKRALNTIWRIHREPQGIRFLIKTRVVAIGLVLGMGFLLLVSLVISAGLSAAYHYFGVFLPLPAFLLQAMHLVFSFGVIVLCFAALFKWLPDTRVAWKEVYAGAVFTALLFIGGQQLLGFYLGREALSSSYGAAGSIIVLLMWVYYSALILYFGAEFTALYAAGRRAPLKKQIGSAAP